MNAKILIISAMFLVSFTSCKGEKQREKEQIIAESISELKTDIKVKEQNLVSDSLETEKNSFREQVKSKVLGTSPGDSIIGVWEVKNDYCMAVYEILKYENKYVGKMHYYNDGETEMKSQNNECDYFLDGITYKDNAYSKGTIYMPDGKQYQAHFVLKGDILTVNMTIDNYPYTEIWKRKRYEDQK